MQTALNQFSLQNELTKINQMLGIEPRSQAQIRFDEIMSDDTEFRRAVFDAALNPLMQRMFKSMVNHNMSGSWHPKDGLPENPSMGQYIAMEVWAMAGGGK